MKAKVFLVRFYLPSMKQKLVREVKANSLKTAANTIKSMFGKVRFDSIDVECCGNCRDFSRQDIDGYGVCGKCSESRKCNEYCDFWKLLKNETK